MSTAIERMLESYEVETIYDQKNAMKEIMQEIVLCGLSRAGFFKKAAFYGGTALRIFYDLDRFSEDLDFSLIQPDLGFSLKDYFQYWKRSGSVWYSCGYSGERKAPRKCDPVRLSEGKYARAFAAVLRRRGGSGTCCSE